MSTTYQYLVLFFFGLLAFCNALQHPFVHDDVMFILKNPHITELGHWYEAFKMPVAADGINTYYRPILEVIYRLEYHFFGPHPFGFHLFNVLVHIANGLLLFGLLQRLGLSRQVSWVVSCIFLIHPVQTEAVCCIAGISNLWMALCVLLALHAYLNRWYAASLFLFAAAFLGKEQGIMFVPLVVIIDFSRGHKNFRQWFLIGFTACLLLYLRHIVTGTSLLKDITASPGELYLRLAAIPRDIGMYLRLIFFPYDLHYYRNTDILRSNTLSWVMALVSLSGIFYTFRRWPGARGTIILGLGWFLAALCPVLNFVPLINEYSFILTPEHFLYLPIVGILIVVVTAADHYLKHLRGLLLGLVISGCLLLTWYQNTFWASEIALFERMLQFEPDFGRGHLLLAKAYYFNGLPLQAESHFEKAYMIMSGYAKKATNLTAKRFYMRYMKEILFDWAQNEYMMGHGPQAMDKLKQESLISAL